MDSQRSHEIGDCPFYQCLKNRPITPVPEVIQVNSARSEVTATPRSSRGRRDRRVVPSNRDHPERGDFLLEAEYAGSVDNHGPLNVIPEDEDDGSIRIHSLSSNATMLVPETRRNVSQVAYQNMANETNFIRPRSAGMTAMARRLADRQTRTAAADNSAANPATTFRLSSALSSNMPSRCEGTNGYPEGYPASARLDSVRSRHAAVGIMSPAVSIRYESSLPPTGYSTRSGVFTASSEVVHRGYRDQDDKKADKMKQYLQIEKESYNEWRQEDVESKEDLRSRKVMEAVDNLYEKLQRVPLADKRAYYEYRLLLGNMADLVNEFALLPVPPGFHLKCRLTRVKEGVDGRIFPRYFLHLERSRGSDILLMTAQKTKSISTAYVISTDPSIMSINSKHCIGYLEGNLSACKYTLYTDNLDLKEDIVEDESTLGDKKKNGDQMLFVAYEANSLGFTGPRKMKVTIPKMKSDYERIPSIGKLKNMQEEQLLRFRNKEAVWNPHSQSFVLNFSGRVQVASVKNFQICHPNLENQTLLQFGRVERNHFVLDFNYPFSPLQAFSIALCSFDVKWGLE